MVTGEAPSRRTSSVRLRLMLPIAAAIAGVLALGTIQVGEALSTDADAGRTRVLADLTNATAKVLHVGQDEVAATTTSHDNDGATYDTELADQNKRVDRYAKEFRDRAKTVRAQVPELDAVLTTANGALDEIDAARDTMKDFAKEKAISVQSAEAVNGLKQYQSIAYRVLDVADALHSHISDPELAQQARALAELAGAKQAAGDQRFLMHNLLSQSEADSNKDGEKDEISSVTVTDIARYQGVEQERLGEFYRAATPRAKGFYSTIVAGPPIERSDAIVAKMLDKRESSYTAKDWDFAQSGRINKLHEVETSLSEDLANSATYLENKSQRDALITGGVVLAVAALSFATAILLALRISRRLRVLRHDALSAAEVTLPDAVAEMTAARSEKQVTDAVTVAQADADSDRRSGPNDEVGAVAQAFTVVHRQALKLASDQAMLRLDVAAMMIALARRGQSLVQRQLHMLTEFAEVERNPDGIGRLRTLNHMASRMRRNEENLLLLAGGDPGRRHSSAISVARAVSEAAAEIEDSSRIVIEDAADSLVSANTAGDLIHLLAELLENAALFSPPTTRVRVATRHTVHEVVISINDEGIGLPPEQVAEINDRLAEPSGLTASLAGTMGLLVVARLASRHGIDVQLHSTAGKGTLAVVRLPDRLVAQDAPSGPIPTRHGGSNAVSSLAAPLALAAEPSSAPLTGTGEASDVRAPRTAVVPHTRKTEIHAQSSPAPARQAGMPSAGRPETASPGSTANTGWFMPATGSGDSPSSPPGSLKWRVNSGDIAYDKARRTIAQTQAAPSSAPMNAPDDPDLPQRRPGARLLPGSIDTVSEATPSSSSGLSDEGLDPEEIRTRLAGFAGGLAAAETGSTVDGHPPAGHS